MDNIKGKLIDEACGRLKPLLKSHDMETFKVLLKMCAYIGGDEWDAEFAADSEDEKELVDGLNRMIQRLIAPYKNKGIDGDTNVVAFCNERVAKELGLPRDMLVITELLDDDEVIAAPLYDFLDWLDSDDHNSYNLNEEDESY